MTTKFYCVFAKKQGYDFSADSLQEFAEKLVEAIGEVGEGEKFATKAVEINGSAWSATSQNFDNSQTGFYETEEEALAAFWNENTFSENEISRAMPYARREKIDDDMVFGALHASFCGYSSPALEIESLA